MDKKDSKIVTVILCDYCGKMFDTLPVVSRHELLCCEQRNINKRCFRCGHDGHYASSCSNTIHKNGYVFK